MFRPQGTILYLTLLSPFLVNALASTNVCQVSVKLKDESCYDLKTAYDNDECESAINCHLLYDKHAVLRAGSLEQSSLVMDSCTNITVSGLLYIEPGGFLGLENITTLVILNDYFDIIEHDMFKHLDNLENLVIGGNGTKIFRLENEAFHNLGTLVNLTLSHNSISNLQTNVFKGLERLTHLDLSHNDLNQLSPYSFSDLHSLENLQVQNNKLTRVSKRAFHNLTNLWFIDLSDNLITVMEEPLFGNDKMPVVLDLTGNPLLCDCRMSWISSWLNISDRKIYGRCHAPEKVRNRSLADVYAVVDSIPPCYNDTNKEGKLLELPCSGVDCTWTTPDGRQLSKHGERQGPYFLTNYDALVIDTNEITAPPIQNFTFVTSENETRVLQVNIKDQDVHFPTKDVIVYVCGAVLVIIIVSLVVVLMVKKPREAEEETSLICPDSPRSSRLTNATQEPTDDAERFIKSPSFMANINANMDHSEFLNPNSSPGPSSSPSFPYNKHGNMDHSESSNSSPSPPSSPSVSYIKYANLDSESSNSDSENMC